jgi:hypothetical protein
MDTTQCRIPTPLDWQFEVLKADRERLPKLTVIPVGRRSGKSHLGILWLWLAPGGLKEGKPVTWAAPSEAHMADVKSIFRNWFWQLVKGPSPGNLGFELINGARIDFWTLQPPHNAFRSRGYALACLDEVAFVRNLTSVIEENLMPSLAEHNGRLMLLSTPKGFNEFRDWYRRAELEGLTYCGATSELNPLVSAEWMAQQRGRMCDSVYAQELLGKFVQQEGQILERHEVRYGVAPPREEFMRLVFGVDPAVSRRKSADWTALAVAGEDFRGHRWLLGLHRWRDSWSGSLERITELHGIWKPDVVIFEAVGFAEAALQQLAARLEARGIVPDKSKRARFETLHVHYHLGEVWHSENLDPVLEGQLFDFSGAEQDEDDVVDAAVYALSDLFPALASGWHKGTFPRWLAADVPRSIAPGWALGRTGQLLKKLGDGRYEVFR